VATPTAIRSALKLALLPVCDNVSEYPLANPHSPGMEIDIDDEGVIYDQSMQRGIDEWWFTVRGFVATTTDIGSQALRDQWLASSGTGSVKAAIETDRTLGGACHHLRVVSARAVQFGTATANNTTYMGAIWRVRIIASG